MSAGDLGVVLVSVAALGAFVALMLAVQSTIRTLRELRATLERIREQTLPMVAEMQATLSDAGAEVDRFDDLISSAESIQHSVEGVSRLAYLAFSNPLIKVIALFRGLRRGLARALGRGGRRTRRIGTRRRHRQDSRAA